MTGLPLSAEQLRARLKSSPFVAFMNLDVVEVDAENQILSLRMPMRPEFERSPNSGRCHGGVISALIDTAGDFAVIMLNGEAPPTINFRTDFLRPAASSTLIALARVRRLGRRIAFVDVDISDDTGELVATGRANYAVTT